MGWWKCNEGGGIDWENKPTGHPGEHSLINAIPDRDSAEDYYNGDAPADAMYFPIAIMKSWFINRTPKPTTEQLTKLFINKEVDPVFRHIKQSDLFKVVDATWKEIDAIYTEAWGRPAYPEERGYCCSFSFSGADSRAAKTPSARRAEIKDWWSLSGLDKDYIKKFTEGHLPSWWHTSE